RRDVGLQRVGAHAGTVGEPDGHGDNPQLRVLAGDIGNLNLARVAAERDDLVVGGVEQSVGARQGDGFDAGERVVGGVDEAVGAGTVERLRAVQEDAAVGDVVDLRPGQLA